MEWLDRKVLARPLAPTWQACDQCVAARLP